MKALLQTILRRSWLPIAFVLLAIACYAIAAKIVNSIDYHNNDFFTFWLAGHMASEGGAPYSPDQWIAGHSEFDVNWIPNRAYVYPLPLSIFFIPLGLLSLYRAYIFWVALSQLMIFVSLLLLLSLEKSDQARLLFFPLLIGMVVFRPTILTLFNGQLSGWLLFILVLGTSFWEKGKWFWGGALFSLLALKPNIGAPLILLLSIWLLSRKQFASLLGLLAGGVILMVIGLIQNPHWIVEYWQVGNTKLAETFGGSPTFWGLAALVCRNQIRCTLPIGGAATLLVLAGFGWLVLKARIPRPLTAIALAVTLTLLITPYTWTYDQLLLIIPIITITLAIGKSKRGLLPAALLFLAIDILTVILLIFNTVLDVEILNAVIPLLVLGLCLVLFPGTSLTKFYSLLL